MISRVTAHVTIYKFSIDAGRIWIKGFFIFILMLLSLTASGQQDKCYPGMDCPEDIPKEILNSPERANPPPQSVPAPQPRQPEYQSQGQENCSNPYLALQEYYFSGKIPTCTKLATHCCFQDGSYMPLQYSGSIQFSGVCYVYKNLFGSAIVVQGYGCIR